MRISWGQVLVAASLGVVLGAAVTARLGVGRVLADDVPWYTLLYDHDAKLAAAGVRSTNGAPVGSFPHWAIQGKIRPIVLGDSPGSVYFYTSGKDATSARHIDGPFQPENCAGIVDGKCLKVPVATK